MREYAQAVDRESAREMLAARMASQEPPLETPAPSRRGTKEPPSTIEQVLNSPTARTIAGQITRGLMGALLGTPPRRRRRSLF